MFTIMTIVGARPQFIKASVVSRSLRKVPDVREILVHTGQHFDDNMSDVFFAELEIPRPDYALGIHGGSHGRQTGRMLEALEEVMLGEKPDAVLVYGDTNSTLAGALAAVKLHIPVLHVEAGLRSFNRSMPEEINRILTDHSSDLLFAPTQVASDHLRQEGVTEEKIHLVGDVMYDAALHYGEKAEAKSRILEQVGVEPRGYVLATIHRAENTNDPQRMHAIFTGLRQVARVCPVVLPLHPRTRLALESCGLLDALSSEVKVIEPLGYLDMAMLLKQASLVATDSGGVQKEAFFYRVPCATLRTETEWTELLELGWNRLVSLRDSETVTADILSILQTRELHSLQRSGEEARPYGEGRAGDAIVSRIVQMFLVKGGPF